MNDEIEILKRLQRIETLLESLVSVSTLEQDAGEVRQRVQNEAAILRARGVDLAEHLRNRARGL